MQNHAPETIAGGYLPRSTTSSLRRNFSWTFAGNAFFAVSQWIVLVILARVGSQTEVGQFALATAISTPIITFANLKLRSVQAADALNEFGFATYLAVRLITIPVALLTILGTIVVLGYEGTVAWVIAIVAVIKAFESVSDIFHGLQQRHERMDVVARSLMIKGVLSIIGFGIGFLSTGSLVGGLFGIAIAWITTFVLYDIPQGRTRLAGGKPRPEWNRVQMKQLALLSLPLGMTVAIGSLSTNVPRYFIEGFLSTEELGIFAALAYIMVAGNMIISAIAQAATPRLAILYRTGATQAHLRLLTKLLVLGASVGLVGIVAVIFLGRIVLSFVYGSKYAAHDDLLFWIMVSASIGYGYVFLGTALTSMRKFNVQLPVHLVGLVVLVIASWWIVPRAGLVGAAWAMLVTNGFQATAYAGLFFKYFKTSADEVEVLQPT